MPTILVVDDDSQVVHMLHRALRVEDSTVIPVTHAPNALQCIQAYPIDLLIVDYLMPEMTGIALATQVRTINPSLPMILITAYPLPTITSQAAALGMRVLNKPFRSTVLHEMVHQALGLT